MLVILAEAVAGAIRRRDFLAVGKPHRRDERAAEAHVADQVLAIEPDEIERVRARRRLDGGEPDPGEQGPCREADRVDHAEEQGVLLEAIAAAAVGHELGEQAPTRG